MRQGVFKSSVFLAHYFSTLGFDKVCRIVFEVQDNSVQISQRRNMVWMGEIQLYVHVVTANIPHLPGEINLRPLKPILFMSIYSWNNVNVHI
jgi:hypothetical protein